MTDKELKEKLIVIQNNHNPLTLSLVSAKALHDIALTANTQAEMIKATLIDLKEYYKEKKAHE